MLTIKEISERFHISKSTLYGWQTDRKELFEYLRSANSYEDRLREINIVLEAYAKGISPIFLYEEIECLLDIPLDSCEASEALHLELILARMWKDNALKPEIFVEVVSKIRSLNVVEKYLLKRTIGIVRERISRNKEEKSSLVAHYFKSFLVN